MVYNEEESDEDEGSAGRAVRIMLGPLRLLGHSGWWPGVGVGLCAQHSTSPGAPFQQGAGTYQQVASILGLGALVKFGWVGGLVT